MHSILIHVVNCLWLVLVMIGVPNVTGLQLGSLHVSATPEFQMLTLGGLGIAAIANVFSGWMLRGNKQKRACWKWAVGHVVLFTIYYLVFSGHIRFQWLKETLLWVKDKLP